MNKKAPSRPLTQLTQGLEVRFSRTPVVVSILPTTGSPSRGFEDSGSRLPCGRGDLKRVARSPLLGRPKDDCSCFCFYAFAFNLLTP